MSAMIQTETNHAGFGPFLNKKCPTSLSWSVILN